MTEKNLRFIVVFLGAVWGWIYPSLAYIIIALMFIMIDNISAYKCNKRVKKKYPNKCKTAKYSSHKAWKTIQTMGITILIIVLTHTLETHVTSQFTEMKVTAMVSCLICGVTGLSILENWSTANDNAPKWLNVLKKFLVDKTERYLNVDIDNDGEIGK
ncbi:MAG: phage holin family protein [Clostridia bacterium]|nr:phage holin family protein [Clostridia bacterium]